MITYGENVCQATLLFKPYINAKIKLRFYLKGLCIFSSCLSFSILISRSTLAYAEYRRSREEMRELLAAKVFFFSSRSRAYSACSSLTLGSFLTPISSKAFLAA